MSVIAFIPARGGSKSIPEKNIKYFCGKPLIYWTLYELQNNLQIIVHSHPYAIHLDQLVQN